METNKEKRISEILKYKEKFILYLDVLFIFYFKNADKLFMSLFSLVDTYLLTSSHEYGRIECEYIHAYINGIILKLKYMGLII